MRSELVYGAEVKISNRFELCRVATMAARKLHRPIARLQDTINEALYRLNPSRPFLREEHNPLATRPPIVEEQWEAA